MDRTDSINPGGRENGKRSANSLGGRNNWPIVTAHHVLLSSLKQLVPDAGRIPTLYPTAASFGPI
jgi:hypothetical protein